MPEMSFHAFYRLVFLFAFAIAATALVPTMVGYIVNASASLSQLGVGGVIGSLILGIIIGLVVAVGIAKVVGEAFGIKLA